MKALCWHGKGDVRIDKVDDPKIEDSHDAIIKVSSCAICGSDLHILDGYLPSMKSGDILGHEFMGEVVEVGKENKKLKVGDRVVVPFPISCGECYFCKKGLFSLCDNSNPNAAMASKTMGFSPAAIFGYSHMFGGFAGGQAEYVRVPYADVGPIKIESDLPDEKVLLLSDVLPTGYMAAENAEIEPGNIVAVWGCGPIGQLTIQCAWMFGAGKVIAIDNIPERLAMAEKYGGAEVINFDKEDVFEKLLKMTDERGPDRCIDAVGCEAHVGGSFDAVMDKVWVATMTSTDRPQALREAIKYCRKGGTISVPGAYIGRLDNIPFGAAMNKGLTIKTGQTHVQKYLPKLLAKIESGKIDPSFIITHRARLDDAPDLYKTFRDKKDGCIKVVMTP